MQLIVEIPDDFAGRFNAGSSDLSRRALELLALEQYKNGHLTETELQRLLGFGTRYELDGFLKAHEVWADVTIEDLRQDLRDLESLGL
ncbi:MAG: UPF0175 family protein [Bryobacteraceae bacterium]|jgi:hypothetical protein